MAAPAAIQLDDLSFSFLPGTPDTLQKVTFSLPAGARCVLVGQNGAGKSTMLEMIAGNKMAAAKSVTVCGEDPFRGSSGKKVALVQGGWRGFSDPSAQQRASFMRVWELLGFPESIRENSADDPYTERLLKALMLRPLMTRYFGSLSDGETRRVELGRKLREQKEIVLLDEATTDLDLLARRNLMSFLEVEGITVVNATHVFDGLEKWATHLLHMHGGKVVCFEEVPSEGPPQWEQLGGLFGLFVKWINAVVDKVEPPAIPPPEISEPSEGSSSSVIKVTDFKFTYEACCPCSCRLDSLELPRGCRAVLVGLNGAGKSTLLSVLSGRRMVAEGSVQVLGLRAFYDHKELDSQVTILSSEWKRHVSELSSGRSVTFAQLAQNLIQELVAAGLDVAVLSGRMLRLIQMLGIDPTKPLGALSDGLMRRVQIALKLLRPSKVLLVDEVTADLDVLARAALLSFLKEESNAGCSIIYCTHILDGLDGWASHILRLRPGGHNGELSSISDSMDVDESAELRLLHQVAQMLEADSTLEPLPPPAATASSTSTKKDVSQLPSGWDKRGTTQAGAYGDYAWNADRGSEENWSFKSVAAKPQDTFSASATASAASSAPAFPMMGQQQQQSGSFPGVPGMSGMPGIQAHGSAAPFQQPGSMSQFQSPGYMPQPQPTAAPTGGPSTSESLRGCPSGWGSRSNQVPYEELVQRGMIQPEKQTPPSFN